MPTITLFKFDKEIEKEELVKELNKEFNNYVEEFLSGKLKHKPINKIIVDARLSYFDPNEIYCKILLYYEKEVKEKYFFINTFNKTVEIYSGERKIIKIVKEILKGVGINLIDFNFSHKKFKPEINYLSHNKRYSIVIESNKLKMNSNKFFTWRPRYEIRQIVKQLVSL
jgi:hypothetical protein